jgi:hypothetical protein
MRNLAFERPMSARQRRRLHHAIVEVVGESPTPRQADFLALCAEVLGSDREPGSLDVFAGDPLADHAVVALIVAACLDRDPSALEGLPRVYHHVAAIGTGEAWVDLVCDAAAGWGTLVTLRLARHAPDGRYLMRRVWSEEGVMGLLAAVGSPFGWTPGNAERAARFAGYADLPEGTVGRTFVETLRGAGIPLPGESGGLQQGAIHHDLLHVLAGYSTAPDGECALGGLYAGFGYDGWPTWTVVTLLTFELGLRVGPTFTPPTRGAFDPRVVWAAALRAGTTTFHPLDADWDLDRLWPLPLETARAQLGL